MITIQCEDFNPATEYEALRQTGAIGAIVTFVGLVRNFTACGRSGNQYMFLEHYPGMTEKVLSNIATQAKRKWRLQQVRIIHRVGELAIGDQIVYVGIGAAHRKDAFAACEFIIDILKTQAPFWKKEGSHWVEANPDDADKADCWMTQNEPQTK